MIPRINVRRSDVIDAEGYRPASVCDWIPNGSIEMRITLADA